MKWFFLFLLTLFFTPNIAQNIQFNVKAFSVEEGLSSRSYSDAFEGPYGFLWVGTSWGLNRYDGYGFRLFQIKDGLQGNDIYRLYNDVDSLLWIQYSPNSNIDILNPLTNEVEDFESYFGEKVDFSTDQITSVFNSQNKAIYIKTREGKYYKYLGKKKWERIRLNIFENSAALLYVYQNSTGETWIHEEDSCYWIAKDEETIQRYFLRDSLYILGTYNQNLVLYEYKTKAIQFYIWNPSFPHAVVLKETIELKAIKNINTDQNHDNGNRHMWNEAYSVLLFQNKQKNYMFEATELSNHLFYSESIWDELGIKEKCNLEYSNNKDRLVLRGDAIYTIHLSYNGFESYPKVIDEKLHSTRGIVMDDQGNLYVQSYDVENCFWRNRANSSEIESISSVMKEANSACLTSILSRDKQRIWMGTENAKIIEYEISTGKSKLYYSCEGDLPSSELWAFWSVYEADDGQLWIGSRDGIYWLDTLAKCIVPFKKYNEYTSLSKSIVLEFYANEKGLWVASETGLYLINKEQGVIAHYHSQTTAPYYIPNDQVSYVYEGEDQQFWLATRGGGLIRLNLESGNYKQWTTKEGLSHDKIHAIYPDDFNNLWISSDYGLMKMNLATEKIITFLPEDGLPHEEFNRKSHYKDTEGNLYFGGLRGIVKFHPENFVEIATPENEITFRITNGTKWDNENNVEVDITRQVLKEQQVDFYPDDMFLTFEYALMDFKDIKNHEYSYKIEGYTNEWITTNKNFIRLNGLPAGKHNLIIRARSGFGQWQKNTIEIKIIVHARFYKTTWFIVLIIGVTIGLISIYYRWRIHRLSKQKQGLEQAVKKRTLQIQNDKETIEKQAEELKKLDELKTTFFVNISHELRTPLTLISSPIQYLLEQSMLKKIDKKQHLSTLKIAYQNSKKLQTLVDEILLLSKLDANKLELKTSAIRLLPFLKQVYASFEPKALIQGVDYQFDGALDLDVAIVVDWEKLERILYNLLSNAFKFAPDGKITLFAHLDQKNNLTIEVKDDGQGIHPDDINQIFDRYYQSKQPQEVEQGGTGIGLALSHKFAQLLGGKIEVVSALNKGSVFRLQIPVTLTIDAHAQELFYLEKYLLPTVDKMKEAIVAKGKSTVLIVEDNQELRAFIQQLLADYYTIITAIDGQDALDVLKQEETKVDLIISDIMMPRLDGYKLSKRLKGSVEWASIPLIILSAKTTNEAKLAALRIGVDDYLIKPFNAQELVVRVHNMLKNYKIKEVAINEIKEEEIGINILKKIPKEEEKEWLEKVEKIALERIKKKQGNFNVADFAEELYVSERQLRRKLKLLVGMSPNQYLRELKLVTAKKYLEENKYPSVIRVAKSVGFKTSSHFIKLYQERFGKSPLEYFFMK